jgi:hypothetical protein
VSRSALFSKTILSTCFVNDSSLSAAMDRYLKSAEQKTCVDYPRGHRVLGIVGKSGIGKTWMLEHMFEQSHIRLDYDTLKGKQSTLEFLARVRTSTLPVTLDEYETVSELVGLRELTGPPSLGMFVIASQVPIQMDFACHEWMLPVPTVEQLVEIAKGRAPPRILQALAEEANGDVRHVLQGAEFQSDAVDNFQSPRQFVYSLLSKDSPEVNPVKFVGEQVHEHGYLYGVVQENYVDTRGASMEELADIADSLSNASLIDDRIYDGTWELMPYFTVDACIWPAYKIQHRLDPAKMRPGSMWTKFQNSRMRSKKFRALSRRTVHSILDVGAILLLRDYCVSAPQAVAVSLLADYSLESQDLDVMNHLAIGRKINAKALGALKKCVAKTAPRPYPL